MEFSLAAGAVAIALGLVLVPMADRMSEPDIIRSASNGGNVDMTVTGSVPVNPAGVSLAPRRIKSISRSVLQRADEPPCITYSDGSDNGHC